MLDSIGAEEAKSRKNWIWCRTREPPAIVEPFGPFFEHADGALAFDEFRCHGFSFTAMRAPVDRIDAAT